MTETIAANEEHLAAIRGTENEVAAALRELLLGATKEDMVEAARVLSPAMRGAWCHAMRAYEIDFESDEVRRLRADVEQWRARSLKRRNERDDARAQLDELKPGLLADLRWARSYALSLVRAMRREALLCEEDRAVLRAQGLRGVIDGAGAECDPDTWDSFIDEICDRTGQERDLGRRVKS